MKFSYNLLKQFAKINLPPEKLGSLLTEHAFEVESVMKAGGDFPGIFAARVLQAQKHPNADRLRIIKLDVGGQIVEPVVCGAFNFEEGDMVALALPGAKIAQNIHSQAHEQFTLERATIRGVQSQGMICAAYELGLSKEAGEGIMLLDKNTRPGSPLGQVLPAGGNDYVLNIALPANRPDLHSHLGLSREIAAVLNKKNREPIPGNQKALTVSKSWKVTVKDRVLCPRYYGIRIKVKVMPSPKFISEILANLGMRPINNVVDITNFVMLELGNPTHAFDAKFVEGRIVVKTAKAEETFFALNHKQYGLYKDTLMIHDNRKPLAIAGIIGGKESEVTDGTREIILEVANFEPAGIRRTSKKIGLSTEGSRMWEKGIHPSLARLALNRCVDLLKKYADAKVVETAKFETPIKNPAVIKFSSAGLNKLLGIELTSNQIVKFLNRYQIKCQRQKAKDQMSATAPWWRTDITTMPDLAEEVLKLYGYNKIQPQSLIINRADGAGSFVGGIYQTKDFFSRLGYTEVQNYNFVSEKDIVNFGGSPKDHVEIQNPLSEEQRYLKKYPLIPLLKNIRLNQNRFGDFKLFEISKQYFGYENEPWVLLAVRFSKQSAAESLVMELKADVLWFLKSLGWEFAEFLPDSKAPWAHLKLDATNVGGLGLADPAVLKNFDVEGSVVLAKLELEKLLPLKKDIIFEEINKFPQVERDISIVLDERITWQQIESLVLPTSTLLKRLFLFEAAHLSSNKDSQAFHQELGKKGQKNLGIRLIFQARDRTLKDQEITGILGQIVLKLKQVLKAEIR